MAANCLGVMWKSAGYVRAGLRRCASTRSGCLPQKLIIKIKERHAEGNVEELRRRARWGLVG